MDFSVERRRSARPRPTLRHRPTGLKALRRVGSNRQTAQASQPGRRTSRSNPASWSPFAGPHLGSAFRGARRPRGCRFDACGVPQRRTRIRCAAGGRFAVAVADATTARVVLAIDSMGIERLAYRHCARPAGLWHVSDDRCAHAGHQRRHFAPVDLQLPDAAHGAGAGNDLRRRQQAARRAHGDLGQDGNVETRPWWRPAFIEAHGEDRPSSRPNCKSALQIGGGQLSSRREAAERS